MRGALDPTEILEDSLEAYFAPAAKGGGAVYVSLLAALCAAVATLPFVRVDVTVRAPGMLRPAIERHRVAASASGVVRRAAVRLGQPVVMGQPLLELRDDALAATLAATDSAIADLRVRRQDLDALVRFAGGLARAGSRAGPVPGSPRYRAERVRALREWEKESGEVAPAGAAARRAGELAARGLLPPAVLEEALLRRDRAEAAPGLTAAGLRANWGTELADVTDRLREAESEGERLRAQDRLRVVRASVTGTVESLTALSPGSWVAAGEEVGVISPAAPLVAEVFVRSRDIARVSRGLPVRLLVDAFDRHEWGALPARVVDVAGDFAQVDGRPAFRVRCALLSTELRRPDGRRARPGKGMAVTAVFVLGRRTLFHLLWDRASGWLEPSVAPDPARPAAT